MPMEDKDYFNYNKTIKDEIWFCKILNSKNGNIIYPKSADSTNYLHDISNIIIRFVK